MIDYVQFLLKFILIFMNYIFLCFIIVLAFVLFLIFFLFGFQFKLIPLSIKTVFHQLKIEFKNYIAEIKKALRKHIMKK